ncbi:MAG: YIP1 family protein [bacterium]
METAVEYLVICRDVVISPFAFFRKMPIAEGVRKAMFFALIIYYVRCVVYFVTAYRQGYFLIPEIKVTPVSSTFAALFLAASPFFLLLILYTQSTLLNRIGVFFGGIGNFEGAFKILAYTLFISLFLLIPGVDIVARVYSIAVLLIGTRGVYSIDWISSLIALFFSFMFTAFLYILLFVPPAYFSRMVMFNF